MPHPLKPLLQLKWTIAKRIPNDVPPIYLVSLFVFAVSAGWFLTKIPVLVNWKSICTVAIIHGFLCSQLDYANEKMFFLRQFSRYYSYSLLIDTLFVSTVYLLLHPWLWLTGVITSIVYVAAKSGVRRNIFLFKFPVISSPVFVKSAYLWHSRRILLPFVWAFMVAMSIVGYAHHNFNLAIGVFSIGVFVSLLNVILQTEESDFVTIYLNASHFMKRTLTETLINTTLFALPIILLQLFLFPTEWKTVGLVFPTVISLSTNLLWMKYIFYPSSLMAAVFYFLGIAIQFALVTTIYGIILLPVYYYILFAACKKRINKMLIQNEISNNQQFKQVI